MIQTEPPAVKLTKTGIPVRNLWHMLLYVWDVVHLKSHWKSDVENAPTLDALLATILANLIQQRLRIGRRLACCAQQRSKLECRRP